MLSSTSFVLENKHNGYEELVGNWILESGKLKKRDEAHDTKKKQGMIVRIKASSVICGKKQWKVVFLFILLLICLDSVRIVWVVFDNLLVE